MNKMLILCAASIAALVSIPYAGVIGLSGQVIDVKRNPVPNAVVYLSRAGIRDTTDQTGAFSLSGTADAGFRIIQPSGSVQSPFFDGTFLNVTVPNHGTDVSIDLIDLSGRQTSVVRSNRLEQGIHRLNPFSRLARAAGITFIRISIDQRVFILKTADAGTGLHSVRKAEGPSSSPRTTARPDSHSQASSPGADDTLIIVKDSFLIKKMPVPVAVDTLDSVFLYPKYPAFTSTDFPSPDGSTSTQPLDMVIACRLLGCSYGWVEQTDLSKKIMAYSSENPQLADSINSIIIKHAGTHDAYVNIITGTKQIAFICRPPSPDERHLSDSLSVPIESPDCALDAFVFIENNKNPVASMTLEQTQKIYTGTITRWDSLGGWPNALQPYQREANSGSQELFIALVMKNLPIISAPSMVLNGMMGPFNKLAIDTNGFCYTVYFYQKFMAPTENVKAIAVDSIVPDYQNIQVKRYPLFAPVVVVTRKNLDPTSNAAILRQWLLAPEGQTVVKESGYVPILEP